MNFTPVDSHHVLEACPCCTMPAKMFRCVPDDDTEGPHPVYLASCSNPTTEPDMDYPDPACAFNTVDTARAKATIKDAAELWNKIARTLVQTRRMGTKGHHMVTHKYVVTSCEEQGLQIFIFPTNIDHDSFAEVLSHIKYNINGNPSNWQRFYRPPVSAGFTDGSRCWGRSETLDLNSSPERDSSLLAGVGVGKKTN